MVFKSCSFANMRLISNRGWFFLLAIGLLISTISRGQLPNKRSHVKNNTLLKNWSIEFSMGSTSYFGDLSQYDLNPINNLVEESLPAVGLRFTRPFFNDRFGLGGQLIKGGFKCNLDDGAGFQTKLFEYNLQFYLDVTKILYKDADLKMGWRLYAGLGQFMFNVSASQGFGDLDDERFYKAQVPEFVYFFGSTLLYNFNETFAFTLDLSTRQAQNDFLDLYRHSNDFDYYSFLALGVSINIDHFSNIFKKDDACDAYDALHRQSYK